MSDQSGDSELRRRAAWLLAMLALVAGLFVVLFTTLLNSSGGKADNQAGPDDTLGPTQTAPRAHSTSSASSSPSSASSSAHQPASCPTSSTCSLDDDIGNAVAAINNYRTQNGRKAVPGSVTSKAKRCALNSSGSGNSGCSGHWAATDAMTKATGTAALDQIKQLGKPLDPDMTSFEVGWAYDPQSKQYYFALIRDD